jgi:ATP-dependent helicase/nuclease subunit A
MNGLRVISEAVREKQRQASDPEAHAWVSANAGSGKTHVLSQRVIRLLLRGVDPARILCLTFTKAAAGNMANRVFDELRRWTALNDADLIEAMKNVGATDTGDTMRSRARKLFALALETPGGLKVQTIHAFCTHILHLFPFEANVAARFSVLDEAQETQLLDKMTNDVLLEGAAKPESDTGRALAYAIGAAADSRFRELIAMMIEERDAVEAWLNSAGGIGGAKDQLSRALELDLSDSEEAIAAEFLGKSEIKPSEWAEIARIGAGGGIKDSEQAERFTALSTLSGARQIDRYIEIFCTQSPSPRESVFTAGIKKKHGPLCDRLHKERDRVWALVKRRNALAARERTIALITIAKEVLDRFRIEKDRRGLLDFEDQIDKTYELLSRMSAAWVHYKLDSGIDHVLIDEAQDTSPKQWGIVERLVAEFFAGKGANERTRTIFAVGDEKQSIFSFQGAAPAEFDRMQREFEKLSGRAGQPFRRVVFDTSLRSGENVLSAVDKVFASAELAASLTSDKAGIPEHIALASAAPGEVEIWETEKPSVDGNEKDPWNAPFDTLAGTKPVVRLAERIARSVRELMAAGRRPGEVLVLVARRGTLFEAVIRSLKNARVPVAGADRLVLTEHIAVMDLLVLADALLLPADNLALATALKSPLFDINEDDIFTLAHGRGDKTLRAMLVEKAADNPKFAQALARIEELTLRSRNTSPFSFYAHLLGAEHGRERFLARLGHEAADALGEFLNLALEFERSETPSLQGFVDWLRAAKSEVKRDMEMVRDEVRVMTVHGAKGLEAPIVILADTTTRPEGYYASPLLTLPAQTAAAPLIWAKSEKEDVGPMSDARQAARGESRDEYRRLLYVAMTRTAEKLIVCGIETQKLPQGCWYQLVMDGLRGQPGFQDYDEDGRKIWRYRKAEPGEASTSRIRRDETSIDKPSWLKQPLATELRARVLTPSGATGTLGETVTVDAEASRRARERGSAIHRLLQSLPDLQPESRGVAAQKFLQRKLSGAHADERAKLAEQALGVLDDTRFAPLFAPGSRAEISIAGEVQIGGVKYPVAGQIDRLTVTETEVLIADYKTNRPPPRRIADVPPSYIRQLALYRAVLRKIYPTRIVRAALIWTETPDLMELSQDVLDDAFAHVTSA